MTPRRAIAALFVLALAAVPLRAQTPAPGEAGHQHPAPAPAAPTDPHAGHQHAAPAQGATNLPAFIPPLTDADRAAAFPDVGGHAMHDASTNYFVLFDQFEWQSGRSTDAFAWDTKGWIGKDRDRFWFRSEGDRTGSRTEQAQLNLLYGRAIARWWDVTAGIRLDTLPGTPRGALAVGIQGLAPYWFGVEATAYVEPSGRTHVRFETDYDLLLANRLVLKPLLEFEIYGGADRARLIDRGLSTGEFGLRLRYEFRRELAPYVGVVWTRRFFGSADLASAAGQDVAGARWTVGLRTWF